MNRLKVISVIGEALASEQAISIGQCSVSFSILIVVKFSGIVPYLFGFSMRSGFILTSYSSLILKNAQQKYEVLQQLINEMGSQSIMDTLLFVSDKQIGRCMEILAENHISGAKITEEESTSRIVNYELPVYYKQ